MSADVTPTAPNRPDVTKAQIIAAIAAGVPIVASLLAAFGVWHLTPHETDALQSATAWATGFAGLLVLGDSHLRASRNAADAVKATARAAAVTGARNDGNAIDTSPPFERGPLPRLAPGPDAQAQAWAALDTEAKSLPPAEPTVPVDEVDLADPALDDPSLSGVGIDEDALMAHAQNAATPTDVAERDARLKGGQA